MDINTQFWVMLVIALLSGWDAIVRNIKNIQNKVRNVWRDLPPIIQLAVVILLIYFLFKK